MIPPGCNIADGGKPVRKSKMDVVQRKQKKKEKLKSVESSLNWKQKAWNARATEMHISEKLLCRGLG